MPRYCRELQLEGGPIHLSWHKQCHWTGLQRGVELGWVQVVGPWGPAGNGRPSAFKQGGLMTRAVLACLFILMLGVHRAHADNLVDSVKQAHRASVESIRTLSCRTRVVYEPKLPTGDEQGEYWRDGDVVRCKHTSDAGRTGDVLVRDGRRLSTDKIPPATLGQGGPTKSTGTITDTNKFMSCDPWLLGLIMFPGKSKYLVSFDVFLAEADKVNSAKRVDDKGRPLVVLDVAHSRGRFEIFFDPGVNYLVRRRVLWSPTIPGLILSDQEVVEFQEGAPGIFLDR